MATIINNPGGGEKSSVVGIIVGVVIALVIIILFFMYGLPALRNRGTESTAPGANINVELPDTSPNPPPDRY